MAVIALPHPFFSSEGRMPPWLHDYGGWVVGFLGAGGGFWAWLSARAQARSAVAQVATAQPSLVLAGAADLQKALTEHTEKLMAAMDRQLAERDARIAAQDRRIAELEADNEVCRGENRQMAQRMDSLVSVLRKNNIPIPEATAPGALLIVEGDRATVFKPTGPQDRE